VTVVAGPGERHAVTLRLTEPLGTIRGRVADERGHPLNEVVVNDADVTDTDGMFELDGLWPDDEHEVVFSVDAHDVGCDDRDEEPSGDAGLVIASRSLRPQRDPSVAEVVMLGLPPELVYCELVDHGGEPQPFDSLSFEQAPRGGNSQEELCGGGIGWGGSGGFDGVRGVYLLWRAERGPLKVELSGPAGRGRIDLKNQGDRCRARVGSR
jgi:hypothetical protein